MKIDITYKTYVFGKSDVHEGVVTVELPDEPDEIVFSWDVTEEEQ